MTSKAKKIALTFDDGPNPPYTNQILDILRKENIKATFFVCGANVKKHPEVVKRIAKEGHFVGNHTYSHSNLKTKLGLVYGEIKATQKLIDNLTGHKKKLFRAPWDIIPPWLKNKVIKEGFKIISYDILGDYQDYSGRSIPSAQQIVKRVIKRTIEGSVILLHDGHNTKDGSDRSEIVKALPQIIKTLKQKNYQFVNPLNLNQLR